MPLHGVPAKVDLHVHTPHGGDYRGDCCTSVEEILARCLSVGLDMIVAADHMTLAAWPEFQRLSESQPSPCALPGVEVKARHRDTEMHFVAVFSPVRAAKDFAVLVDALDPFTQRNGSLASIEILSDPAFVAGAIKACGALCVAAHVDRFCDTERSAGSVRLVRELAEMRAIDGVEFDDPSGATRFALPASTPCVTSSDSHSLQEIGRRHTRLLLPEMSFDGLRCALEAGRESVVDTLTLAIA